MYNLFSVVVPVEEEADEDARTTMGWLFGANARKNNPEDLTPT
jgi:hypothetical protein